MNMSQDDEDPVVGQPFRGAGIVKKIKETKQSRLSSGKWTVTRQTVTMSTGVIFLVDHFVEERCPPSSSSKKKTPKKKPSRANSSGTESLSLAVSELTPDVVDKARALRIQKEANRAVNNGDDTETSDSTAPVPMTIFVYSKDDPDLPAIAKDAAEKGMNDSLTAMSNDGADHPLYGVWTINEDEGWTEEEEEDAAFWKPQEVTLWLDTQRSLDTIPEMSEDGLSTTLTTPSSGIWGYAENHEDRFQSGGDLDTSLRHALVVPPKRKAPENFVKAGVYTINAPPPDSLPPCMPSRVEDDAPSRGAILPSAPVRNIIMNGYDDDDDVIAEKNTPKRSKLPTWPPPVDHVKKQLHNIGKLSIPKVFVENDGKVPAKVFPKSKMPPALKRKEEPEPAAPKKKGVSFAPPVVAHWEYPKGQEQKDSHLMPVDIDFYWGNDMPPSRGGSVAGASTEDSMDSWGLWGTASTDGSIELNDGEFQPEKSMVFPPGFQPGPDPDIAILGRWAYRMTQNTQLEWPPKNATTAIVHRSNDAPETDRGNPKGVWGFPENAEDQAVCEGWDPLEVELVPDDASIDESSSSQPRPSGVWGVRRGAEADRNYDWEPKDVIFYPPNVEASKDTWVQGRWAMKRGGKLKCRWPPPPTKNAIQGATKPRTVGKLDPNRWSKEAWVYPSKSAPRSRTDDDGVIGVWKFPDREEPANVESWAPQHVDLHRASVDLDDSQVGFWGVNPDIGEDIGNKDVPVKDIWFYPPSKSKPSTDESNIQGKWTLHPSKVDRSWPPTPMSPMASPRRRVGKLKIPGAFAADASPRPGTKGKLPSLFNA